MSALEWSAVLPVKRTDVGKSRLTLAVPALRPTLALAFAADTIAAVTACPAVTAVVVVTDDARAAAAAEHAGAIVVSDEPDRGLNPALVHGAHQARRREPGCPLVLVSADLPALRPDELARALGEAADLTADGRTSAFVADASGIGTTVLTAGPGADVRPQYGARSRARHRAAGVTEITRGDIPSVRRDVDTEVDLWDAARLGLGPHTRRVLARLQPRER